MKINRVMKCGLSIVISYFLWGLGWLIVSRFIWGTMKQPYLPKLQIDQELLAPFTSEAWLGTDMYGRSIFQSLSEGLLYSLSLSLLVTLCTSTIGIIMGHLSLKGPILVRKTCDLFMNIMFLFPTILVAILIISLWGQSQAALLFSLVITGWPGLAKIAKAEMKRVHQLPYVESAYAVGMGEWRMLWRIILPGILPIIVVNMILNLSGVIWSESALGFLGLGGSPYSLGALLSNAKTVLLEAPFVSIILSITMAGLIMGLNLLGDGLRDFLDPKVE